MIAAIGIILGVIAVVIIGYPFLKKGPNDSSADAGLEDEIERQIIELRQDHGGKSNNG